MNESTPDELPEEAEGQQTRWWAIITGLALTGALAWFMINFYQNAVPKQIFQSGVEGIRQGDWPSVRRAITSLKGNRRFDAQRCYLQAAVEIDQGDLDAAEALLETALKNPDVQPFAYVLAGVIALQRGEFDVARENVQLAKELDPSLAELEALESSLEQVAKPMTRVARAMEAINQGDLPTIENEIKALQAMPGGEGEPYAKFIGGVVQLRSNKYEQALMAFGAAKDHPDLRTQTLTLSGEALYKMGQYPAAINLFYEALETDPDFVDAHRWLAMWFYDQGALDHASAHLIRITELAPEDYRPYRLLGLMHKDFQDFEEAIQNYDAALERSPPVLVRAEILLEKAQSQAELRQYTDAMSTLDSPVIKEVQEPNFRDDVKQVRAECYLNDNKVDQAEELIDELLARDANNLDALVLKGTLLQLRNQLPEAIAILQRATQADPYSYTAHFKLATAYQANGDREAAQATLKRADRLKELRERFSALHEQAADDLESVDIRYQLGTTAMELGRPDLASVWFQAVLQLDPNHANARAQLEQLSQNQALINNSAPQGPPAGANQSP